MPQYSVHCVVVQLIPPNNCPGGKRIVCTAPCCSLGLCSICCCFMCNYPLDFYLRSLLFLLEGGHIGGVVEALKTAQEELLVPVPQPPCCESERRYVGILTFLF